MLVFKSGYLEPCAGSAFCLEMWSFLGGKEGRRWGYLCPKEGRERQRVSISLCVRSGKLTRADVCVVSRFIRCQSSVCNCPVSRAGGW